MIDHGQPLRVAGFLAALFFLLAAAPASRPVPVDVMVLVVSGGKGADQLSVTYAGSVPEQQALQDVQSLASALNCQPTNVRVSTKPIARNATPMTSVEAHLPDLVSRAEGTLAVQQFVETYRRFSRMRLNYIIEPPFKLVSPAKPLERGDVQMSVDNQGSLVSYDVHIRHAAGDTARIPSLDGSGAWGRLAGPAVFLGLLLAAAIGATIFVLVRRGSAARASTG